MHNDEIIQATPAILQEVISSPQVVYAAEAYFIALSDTMMRLNLTRPIASK